MAFIVQCSQCSSSLRLPEAAAGKPATCPTCGTEFTVPSPGQAGVEVSTARSPRPNPGRTRTHPARLACYGVAVVVVGWAALWGLGVHREASIRDRFADRAREWGRLDFPRPEGIEPSRHGKVAVIRAPLVVNNKIVEEGSLDALHFDVSSSIRTDDPAEVGTVVLCRHTGGKVGDYVDEGGRNVGPAIQVQVTVHVLDLERKVATAVNQFLGDPDSVLESAADSKVGRVQGVVEWIESLPER